MYTFSLSLSHTHTHHISIICPDEESSYDITLWTIMSKVRLESCMWVSQYIKSIYSMPTVTIHTLTSCFKPLINVILY